MMLLDTCVLFWLEHDPQAISTAVARSLKADDIAVFASAISVFELGLKVRDGQLRLPLPVAEWVGELCRRRQITVLPVNEAVAGLSTELPPIHRDPCDRFLIATAQLRRLRLATPDQTIRRYPNLQTIW
jgi:PIN domain nuclease of toxin-antitoxin system